MDPARRAELAEYVSTMPAGSWMIAAGDRRERELEPVVGDDLHGREGEHRRQAVVEIGQLGERRRFRS